MKCLSLFPERVANQSRHCSTLTFGLMSTRVNTLMAEASDEVGVEATPGGYTLRLSGQAPASPPPARSGRLTNERAMANTDDRLSMLRAALSRRDQQRRCYSATYNTLNVCRHLTTALYPPDSCATRPVHVWMNAVSVAA